MTADDTPWQPINTAPDETELLVGRFVNEDWCICQSGRYFDEGNEREGEPSYWFWHCDWDNGGVTDGEGPTHWMPLPPAPPMPLRDQLEPPLEPLPVATTPVTPSYDWYTKP